MNMITNKQIKAIWAAASDKGLDRQAVYSVIYSISGKEHMSEITYVEAAKVLDRLNDKKINWVGETAFDKASIAQQGMLKSLQEILGWGDEELTEHVNKKFKIDAVNRLSKKQASDLIEYLKFRIKIKSSDVEHTQRIQKLKKIVSEKKQ